MTAQKYLHKVVEGCDLSENEMVEIMTLIMEGKVDRTLLGAFLTALSIKGESVEEISGAAKVMRKKAETLKAPEGCVIDTCGTGGDGANTFNISTTVAFVVAGAEITVAKHGNRAISSKSGSADVLKSLGVNIEADKSIVEKCLNQIGIGFLFAPAMHKAMKHAADVRRELGFRTIFNLLGPLTNPAKVKNQVIGVFDKKWTFPVAKVLKNLGSQRAYVVHGEDGLDEITLTTKTKVCYLNNNEIKEFYLDPEKEKFPLCDPEDLKGGTAEENAEIIKEILQGREGPKADIVLLNAGAAIEVAGKADSLSDGIMVARKSINTGAAMQKLNDLCRLSHS